MVEEDSEGGRDFATQIQGSEIPIWPNLPEVPLAERRRAWCLSTAIEAVPFAGKPAEFSRNMVECAAILEDWILQGKPAAKLKAVKE